MSFYSLFRDRYFSTNIRLVSGSRLVGFYSLFRDRYFSTRHRRRSRPTRHVSIRCFATGTSRQDARTERLSAGSFYSLFRDRYFSTHDCDDRRHG